MDSAGRHSSSLSLSHCPRPRRPPLSERGAAADDPPTTRDQVLSLSAMARASIVNQLITALSPPNCRVQNQPASHLYCLRSLAPSLSRSPSLCFKQSTAHASIAF